VSELERSFVVARELGMHARPASELVKIAGQFEADIEVGNGREWVNGRSVLSILSLAATQGTTLTVRANGGDAEAALTALGEVIERPGDS
jgi:phosphotransferase system HPr (HPr) family protein